MSYIDVGIIAGYLLLTLALGLFQSRKIKSMKDYAIADRNYATPVMVATISATLIGGGCTFGIVEKVAVVGISYLIVFLEDPIAKLIIARFVAPRMDQFKNMISVGDMMESLYGRWGKVLTGISGSLFTAGLLGAQISALGVLFHFFFGLSHLWGVIIGFGIVIAYSTFGGIRAVALTDVVQFAVLIVAIPMLCNVGLNLKGGYLELFQSLPDKYVTIIPEKNTLIKYLSLALTFLISFCPPVLIQRLLLARDSAQIRTSFTIAAILDVPFYLTVGVIALLAISINPDVNPSLALPYLANQILPIGLKGLVIAGILAVIMSTCDSHLNAASISLVHDTLKPLYGQMSHKLELTLAKITTFALGILSMIVAVKYKVIMDIVVGSLSLWGPLVVVPLYAGIFGFRTRPSSLFVGALCGFTSNLLWMYVGLENTLGFDGLLPSMFMNAVGFFTAHICLKKKSLPLNPGKKSPVQKLKKSPTSPGTLYQSLRKGTLIFCDKARVSLEDYKPPYLFFGVFALINYVFPYFMWSYTDHFVSTTILRFLGGIFAFLLMVKAYWPDTLKKYLDLYWFFTLTYCLPFLMTYMLLENQASYNWIVNASLVLLLLSVLVNWFNFLVILSLGIIAGIGTYVAMNGMIMLHFDRETLFWIVYMYSFSIIIGFTFSRSREFFIKERHQTLKSLGASIAHEMRTPLSNIEIVGTSIKDITHDIEKIAHSLGDKEKEKLQSKIKKLMSASQTLMFVSSGTQNLINILLMNLRENFKDVPQTTISMGETIEKALEEYPFQSNQRHKVHVDPQSDFDFIGNEDLMMHVLFNLLKNSLYFIHGIENGEIFMTLKKGDRENILVFKDTGPGIERHKLHKLFKPFYSKRNHGTGVGLFFCKKALESFGGRIKVDSQVGKHTTFTLHFPKVKG